MNLTAKLETALLSSSNLSSTIAAAHSIAEDKEPMLALVLNDLLGEAVSINQKINTICRLLESE